LLNFFSYIIEENLIQFRSLGNIFYSIFKPLPGKGNIERLIGTSYNISRRAFFIKQPDFLNLFASIIAGSNLLLQIKYRNKITI